MILNVREMNAVFWIEDFFVISVRLLLSVGYVVDEPSLAELFAEPWLPARWALVASTLGLGRQSAEPLPSADGELK